MRTPLPDLGYYSLLRCWDHLGVTEPKAYGVGVRMLTCLFGLITSVFWLMIYFVGICFPLCFGCVHKRRAEWALRQWGSDHMPVVVELEPAAGVGIMTAPRVHGVTLSTRPAVVPTVIDTEPAVVTAVPLKISDV